MSAAVTIVLGGGAEHEATDLDGLLDRIVDRPPLAAFDETVIAFFGQFSRKILLDPAFRGLPEAMALGHWLRPAHLEEFRSAFLARTAGRRVRPRGLALHFVPANVDAMFVYSWAISALCGNANVLRLSRRRSPQMTALLETSGSLLAAARFKLVAERTLLVTYDHDRTVTAQVSSACDVRVIWGGDPAVQDIRAVALPPLATEIVFGDRFSLAALSAQAVLALGQEELEHLAERFHADTFYFAQMACSSPRLVCWIGTEAQCQAAQERFWRQLSEAAERRGMERQAALGIRRMTAAYAMAARGEVQRLESAGPALPLRVTAREPGRAIRDLHPGGMLFVEVQRPALDDLVALTIRKDQTLAVYGFSPADLAGFAERLAREGRGIDRIVPVGQALAFEPVWDGYDLWTHLTREIRLG